MKQLILLILINISFSNINAQCACNKIVQNSLDLYILCDGFLEFKNDSGNSYATLGTSKMGENYFLHLTLSIEDRAQVINSMLSLSLEGDLLAGAILVQKSIIENNGKEQAHGLFSITKQELKKISASKIKSLRFNLLDGTKSTYSPYKNLVDLETHIKCIEAPQIISEEDIKNAEKNNIKAVDAQQNGDINLAIENIDLAIKQNPKQLDYFMAKAMYLAEIGKHQEAYDFLSHIIERHPNYSNTYDYRASLLSDLGQYEDAILDYNQAVNLAEKDSYKAQYLNNRANLKNRTQDFQGGYEDLKMALELRPDYITALNNIGSTCKDLGKMEEALSYFKKALVLDSLFDGSYINIGFFLQSQGKDKEAIEYLNKAIHLNPNSPYAYSNRSLSLFKIGNTGEALKDINHSLELDAGNSYAYWIRASIYLKKENRIKACADLDTATDLGYSNSYGDEVEQLIKENCAK